MLLQSIAAYGAPVSPAHAGAPWTGTAYPRKAAPAPHQSTPTRARGRQVREYGIHRALRHASVVALTDLFEIDAAAFATVLELCPGGDLDAHLQRHPVRRSAELSSQPLWRFLWTGHSS